MNPLDQLARHVGKLALLQLRLPENGVCVVEAVLLPALLLDMVQVDETTRVGISVGGCQNTSLAELEGLLNGQFVFILGIQHTVRKGLTRSDTEKVTRQTSAITVDIIQSRALLLGHTGTHGAHAQSHSLVAVDQVGEDLAGGRHADAALVTELVQTALHAQPGEPVLAIGSTTGHGAEEDAVDLDDLLDGLRGDPVAGGGSRIGSDDDAALKAEGEGCGTVGDLDGTVGVGTVVGCGAEP